VRLGDPAGVVAAVPYLLGFTPERSLVVVGIDGDGSVGPTLRLDLALSDPPALVHASWERAAQVMTRNSCPRALVLVYAEQDPDDVPPLLRARLLDGVDALERFGIDVLDVLLVGPGRFASLLCGDPSCCPAGGRALEATRTHAVAASFVLAGCSPAKDRGSVEPVVEVPEEDRRIALRAAERARGGSPGSGPELLGQWLDSLPEGPDPAATGRLVVAWSARPRLRDACLAALLPGGRATARTLLRSAERGAVRLDALLSDPSCTQALGPAAPVLRRMAALSEGPGRAAVLAGHAWLAWAAGAGTAAGVLAERALQEEPGQSLAGLVLRCLDHGVGAPWTTHAGATHAGGTGGPSVA
jgi:hypothetical protein